ncbi:MAG TPA: potassium-transporting ATPase subunit KdpA [Albitalea sp.]|uniref:potassium-transporting ATPase subunit KdpA n=1 Tax=Piscinibacter sp. TaxID=1903157 RepID=UPI002ED0CF6A
MTAHAWSLLTLYSVVLVALAWPLGGLIVRVMEGRFAFGRRIEAPLLRIAGVDPDTETGWLPYALGLLLFNLLGALAVYALQRLQAWLPLNPAGFANVAPDSAFNSAVSFATNTNWQGYSGEQTMSHLTQMLGLAVQNFLSAASGIVVAVALIRGFVRRSADTIGNVWVDLTRAVLWLLLPACVVCALFFASQGVVQSLVGFVDATTLEGATQALPLGPVASQEAIKMLGTNGGGFFNANSAHPFENPSALTNFVQMLAIFLIPAALCSVLGRMVGDRRQGWTLLGAMGVLFVAGAIATTVFEQAGNPLLTSLDVDQAPSALQAGGNMEGKETRFGIADSALFATITTDASSGAVNGMHDSFTPLGGMVPLVNIQLGEVVFGGVGAGLYGMLIFAIFAVFIAGLMIGRTPEYLGKKIEAHEMKMAAIVILVTPLLVLAGTAVAVLADAGRAGIANPGPHGFSEILYALSSAANNNGSAFAGLSANTPFYNTLLGIVMWIGRFAVIVPVLAIAGSLAAKKRIAPGAGTLPTHGLLFGGLLVGVVLLIGLLNYVPALALGPAVEHLMLEGATR